MKKIYIICVYLLITGVIRAEFQGTIEPIPEAIKNKMVGCSWKPECPVPLEDLRYLTVSHWGYDGEEKVGHIVVHVKLSGELLAIFNELYDAHFLIERMELIDFYDANDECSMAANNSSAFCCRPITNAPGTFSLHSYGIAIDINPLVNPYVKGTQVLPEGGKAYLDRMQPHKGIITKSSDNACYRIFTKYGYEWGGDWTTRVDYQHFQKPISALHD